MDVRQMLRMLIGHYSEVLGSVNAACNTVSKRLKYKWTGKYISHVHSGLCDPGPKLKRAITKLYKETYTKYPRHRLYIQALSPEQKANWVQLTMEQRREALDRMYLELL